MNLAAVYDENGNLISTDPSDADGTFSSGLPASTDVPSDWFSKALQATTDALPKLTAFLSAEKIAAVNADRAKQGLPPVSSAQYGPQVGVALSPTTERALTYGLGGIAVAIIAAKLLRRRARA